MSRDTLNLHIQEIKDEISAISGLVENATLKAIESLKNRDFDAAREIYLNDRIINEKRYQVENSVLIQIATQQPLAHDLRLLAAMLEIASELERMGDYAKGICKVTLNLGNAEVDVPIKEIEAMGKLAVEMLHEAIDIFLNEDVPNARLLPEKDDQVDKIFSKVEKEIIRSMVCQPENIDHSNLLLWVVHNIERMADRVTNICERTIFVVTGDLVELESKPRNLVGK
jgi:phosphate transport system protein